GRAAGVRPSMSERIGSGDRRAAGSKARRPAAYPEIEKLKLPDRQAAADAIRPLFGATGPANRAARTAARGAGSRQSRRSAWLRQKTGRFRSGKETGQSERPCRTTCRAVRSCTNRCTTGPAPVLLAAATTLFALLQSRQPIGDRSISSRSGSRRHCRGDVRIFFGALRSTQRLGLHVEGGGAIAGRLRRPGHRVEGDVDAAATATAEAGDGAGGSGTRCGPLFLQRGMVHVVLC